MARIAKKHKPDLEPFASMSQEEILALMARMTDTVELAFLQEFLYDKMAKSLRETQSHAQAIAEFLIREYGVLGDAQDVYLYTLAGRFAVEIAGDMPENPAFQKDNHSAPTICEVYELDLAADATKPPPASSVEPPWH